MGDYHNHNGPSCDENDGNGLWSQILDDVQSNISLKLPTHKNLVILGDNNSGKSSLVSRLLGSTEPKRGHGLEYHFMDVKDHDRDDESKLGIWILDGNPNHQNLLKFALSEDTLPDTVVLLVASIESPWSLFESLQQWSDILERYIERLKVPGADLTELRDSLVRHFQDYTEPDSEHSQQVTLKRAANPLHPSADPDKVSLPLPEGTFVKNLGVPVVVVITKSDTISTVLEKDFEYSEDHFDFIQYHLRMFCLKYGASLFYTSVKEDKNCDILRKYLLHRIYAFPFSHPAYVVERDCIFVPAGWDNPSKAYLLAENISLTRDLTNERFDAIITRPQGLSPPRLKAGGTPSGKGGDLEVAEDEQVFLMRLQTTLAKQGPAPSPGAAPRPGKQGGPRAPGKAPVAGMGAAAGAGAAGMGAANDGVLANFFNSLLSKKSGAPGTPAGSTAAPGSAPNPSSTKAGSPGLESGKPPVQVIQNSSNSS